ncbi:uncharacterized protein rab44 isoform X2 [Cottoperca gobio]|uniref:Uncharacterized protein rab44 isoform X2 n=1 Tax=Cottoperca gobio TaxID=56716 RepID=A0A6J2PRY5_COTGO|nr:uncharacterized protein LOC115008551 isoform X2 [Cottoperca gobio]
MSHMYFSSERGTHDATDNSEIISGDLTDQTEIRDTYQSELVGKRTDDAPTNQDILNPDDKQDEHPTKQSHFEDSEQKDEDYHVSDTKEPQVSDIERVDSALGQVYEIEGRVEYDIQPSAEQTGHQEKEGLLSEMEESESQPQQNIGFNPIGNRRKLGSSRRNKGRQHVKDSAAESYHKPTEEVVGNTRDNEPLETTEMSLTKETSVQEQSMETMLEGMDIFVTAPIEDVEEQNEIFNLSEVTDAHQSEDDLNKVHEQEVKSTEIQEMTHMYFSSERGTHDATDNSENISGDLTITTKESNVEDLEQKDEDYHVSDTKEPQISDIERVDSALGQVYEIEGRVEYDIQPSAEQTGHQEKEGLFSEMEESESQPQQNIGFNPIGNRRKLGSSRRNKGRQHVKDSAAESYHKPTEEVVSNTRDNEPLETTEGSFTKETSVQEQLMETMLEGMDIFDTAPTEDVSDQVKENAHVGTCVGIDLHSSSAVDQQTINQSNVRENPDEEPPNVCSVTEQGNKERDEDTELFWQDGNLQTNYLMSESQMKSEDKESSIMLEISTEQDNLREHTEAECSVEQAIFPSPEEELPTIEEQNEIFNLSEVKDAHQSEDDENEVHEQEVKPKQIQEMYQIDKSSTMENKSSLQTLPSEMNVPLDSQPPDTSQSIKETHTGYNPTGNRRKFGSSRRNKGPLHVKENTEALSCDKERNMQQTNATSQTVGELTVKDHNSGVESSMYLQVYGQDEDGEQSEDPTKKDNESHEINVSQEITHAAAHNKTDTLAPFDIGLEENFRAEPAVDVSEERSKQKRRKMGSTRRTQLNRKPQEKTGETKDSDFNTEADMQNLDKMEVVEELPMIVTADVSQNENTNSSQSPVNKEKQETNETSPVHDNTDNTKNTGFTGGSCVSSCENTQSMQEDVERPESVNVIQDQALKSAEAPVVVDLEIVKPVVRGGAGEEHMSAQASKQQLDDTNEETHNKNLDMMNASPNLDSTKRRRKMGSTRRSLVSRTKREDLHQEQEVDDDATETATNVGDVKTEGFSDIIEDELQHHREHKDTGAEQRKEKAFETVEYSNPPALQTFEEHPVTLVEKEHRLTPNHLPTIPSTSPKHDLMSEMASGRRRRKMGSNRRSHGHQTYENQTASGDKITDTQNGKDARSNTDESAMKTTEEPRQKSLGPDKISQVDKSEKNSSSNIRTSKEGEHPRTVREKTVQHPYAEIRLGHESQQKFSLGNSTEADLRSNAYNVMMIGDSSVGKTSFMKRAQSGKFSLDLPASVGLDSCMWTVIVDGKTVVIHLWDTAGQERFHSITRQIFHKAHAFVLMYDITSSQSFSAVSYWANCIQEGAAENVNILLVGNKSDRAERQVQTQEGEILAKEYNFEFMECSAATGENVVHSLETVARMLSQKVDTREEAMVLHKEPPQKKSSGCC